MMTNFASRLRHLMNLHNIASKEIAILLKVDPSLISKYLNGTRSPLNEKLVQLSNYFEVSTDYLLGLTDDKKRTAEFNEEVSSNGKMTNPIKEVVMKMEDLPLDYQKKILAMVNMIADSTEKDK